jgi:hypothetical protein
LASVTYFFVIARLDRRSIPLRRHSLLRHGMDARI